MASNISQRKIQGIVLAYKVEDYATWSLIVACGSRRSPRTVPLAELSPALTIMQTLMRMRCRTCHSRVEAALLDNNVKGWRARIIRVCGPGSYG